MAIFVIFWCAVLGTFFWLLSMGLKSIQSVINGAYEAIVQCIALVIMGVIGWVFFFLLYIIAYGIRTGGFWDMLGNLILGFIVLGFLIGILGGLGAVALEIVIGISIFIISVSIAILELLNELVENAYIFFLGIIKNKVDCL